MPGSNGSRVLGRTVEGALTPDQIEIWPLHPAVERITVTGGELQAVCPVTRNPDVYDFVIEHEGRHECESKALKMYLLSHRDRPISCASLAATIATDLAWRLGTAVTVHLTQQTRGGMRLEAEAVGRPAEGEGP